MKTFPSTPVSGFRRLRHLLGICTIAAGVAIAAVGCGDDPVQPSGYQAKGLVLRAGGADTVVDSSGVRGSLQVAENQTTGDITASFIAAGDLKRSVPQGSEYALGWTVADSTIAAVDLSTTPWSFRVRGKKAGTTTLSLKLMKGGAAVFTSSAITITVTAAGGNASGLKQGDTVTYSFYDRDTTNTRVENSRKTKVWTVLRTDLTMFDSTGVAEILEVTYNGTGSTELGRDTIYLRMTADGSIYQYDLLRTMLGRLSVGDALGSSLDPYWVRVSSASTTSAASWSSTGRDSITANDVTAPGIPAAMNLVFRMTASHKGTQPVTVAAGSYPAAVHTDHTLRMNVRLAGALPLPVLNDSLLATYDVSAKDGILRHTFQGKMLVTLVGNQRIPVTGYEMEMISIRRKQ